MALYSRLQPNKVLSALVETVVDLESWPFSEGGDPWWEGGPQARPYKWEITIRVDAQPHGDWSTRRPYGYDADDIYIGDWIADVTHGICLRISDILYKDRMEARVVIEDVDRHNTFSSSAGNGRFPDNSECIIFEVSEYLSRPVINPLPQETTVSVQFYSAVIGRFAHSNPLYKTLFKQDASNLEINASVWVNPATGLFEIATGDNIKYMVGTVERINQAEDAFYLVPTTKVVDGITPILPGSAGDIIFVDSVTGEMTTVEPALEPKATYIQLTNSTADYTRSYAANPVVAVGDEMYINDNVIVFTGTTPAHIVDDINTITAATEIYARVDTLPTVAETDHTQLKYGKCAILDFDVVIEINGVPVAFTDGTHGTIEHGFPAVNAEDMAAAINAANIQNITACGEQSIELIMKNSASGSITITNVTPSQGVDFAGDLSITGLPLFTPSDPVHHVEVINPRGTGLIMRDKVGVPTSTLVVPSVRNGTVPAGLVVEQHVRSGAAKVYATIDDLPVYGVIGDNAYIIDSDDGAGNKQGEWTLFLYDGSQWVKISDEDSANSDANTLEIDIDHTADPTSIIGVISEMSRVVLISVAVSVEFDGNALLNIGDSVNLTSLMKDELIDLSTCGTYTTSSDTVYTGGDTVLTASFNAGTSTTGSARIVISYQ